MSLDTKVSSPDRGHKPRSGGGSSASRHVDPTRRQQAVAAWVLALPFTLLFLAFTLGPVLASFGMSFTDMRRADIRSPFAVAFVGLDNYVKLLEDPVFRKVTVNTLLYLVLGGPLTMALALGVAVLLNRIVRFKGFFRVGYYLPVVTSIVAVSVVWKYLYRDNGGVFNTMLSWVGLDGPAWLDSTTLALPSLIVMAAWRNFGTLMIIFLAGLQTIPKEMTEAAEVDGATGWGRFRYITLPLITPFLFIAGMIRMIDAVKSFDIIFAITQGGPGSASETINLYLYSVAFIYYDLGYGSAIAVIFFLLIVAMAALMLHLRQRTMWTEIGSGA